MEEKLLSFKEVCECVAKGEEIQGCLYRKDDSENEIGEWFDFIYDTTIGKPFIQMNYYNYRRKPTKTMKPWTRDTAPKCGEVLTDEDGDQRLIVAVLDEGVYVGGDDSIVEYDKLLIRGYKHNGKPCGTEVEG